MRELPRSEWIDYWLRRGKTMEDVAILWAETIDALNREEDWNYKEQDDE